MEECTMCKEEPKKAKKPLTKAGKVILGITGASFIAITAVTTPFMLPAIRKVCLPFVPATTAQVNNVMRLLEGRSGRLIDLGSGDGRIVIEAAKRGFKAEGIELNPWLVWYSKVKAYREGVHGSTKFYTRNLWKHNLSPYDSVVIFGVDSMMNQLEVKFAEELGKNSQVLACRFPLEHCKPSSAVDEGIDSVWMYNKSDMPNSKQLRRLMHRL